MTLAGFSRREREYLRLTGRLETIETYFDWSQTHLSEFKEGRR